MEKIDVNDDLGMPQVETHEKKLWVKPSVTEVEKADFLDGEQEDEIDSEVRYLTDAYLYIEHRTWSAGKITSMVSDYHCIVRIYTHDGKPTAMHLLVAMDEIVNGGTLFDSKEALLKHCEILNSWL